MNDNVTLEVGLRLSLFKHGLLAGLSESQKGTLEKHAASDDSDWRAGFDLGLKMVEQTVNQYRAMLEGL